MVKLFHILLACLVYTSSVGLVMNSHFCQGELKSHALFSKPESCHGNKDAPVCPFHQKAMEQDGEDNNCCQNKSKLVKEELKTPVQVIDFVDLTPAPAICLPAKDYSTTEVSAGPIAYLLYKPPIVDKDISTLFQTFLL
ncbi:MAG: hypothetical protein GYB31_04100 [Bacteroidetes bacterium]|nr:hypothetical protein [Bacteroidota bacterium]